MSADTVPFKAVVLFEYDAVEDAELTVAKGDTVTVVELNEEGWALAEMGDKNGWIPFDFIEKIADEQKKAAPAAPAPVVAAAVVEVEEPAAPVVATTTATPAAVETPVEPEPEPTPAPEPEPEPAPAAAVSDDAKAILDVAKTLEAVNNITEQTSDKKACHSCKKPISTSFVVAKSYTFHPDCFVCETCDKKLGGQPFIDHEGLFYCEPHYYQNFNPKCGHCNEVILGQYIQALGQAWHPDHFVCTECGCNLEGFCHKHENKPYCETHFKSMFGENCAKCNEVITGEVFEAVGKKFHLNCFSCCVGDHQLGEGTSFNVHDDKIYCTPHFQEQFMKRCEGCSKMITAQFINVMNKHYHPTCWKCTSCEIVLTSSNCTQTDGVFYCKPCVSKTNNTIRAAVTAVEPATDSKRARKKSLFVQAPQKGSLLKSTENKAATAEAGGQYLDPSSNSFKLEELTTEEVPEGVDPARKHAYLSVDDFQALFGMDLAAFDKMPGWKRNRDKKKKKLF